MKSLKGNPEKINEQRLQWLLDRVNNPTTIKGITIEAIDNGILSDRLSIVKVSVESKRGMHCQHCEFDWKIGRKQRVLRCPRCKKHLNAPADAVKVYRRPMTTTELRRDRFKPDVMKELVARGIYVYTGIPANIPTLTAAKSWRRRAYLDIADFYLKSKYSISDIALGTRTSRSLMHQRIKTGVKLLSGYGVFVITDKGRQVYAAAKMRGII